MAFTPQTINKELDMANLAKHNANYSAIKTELDAHDAHIAAQTAHGSTSAATAGKIVQRDSAGRAKVAAPAAADDIARKAEVDAVQVELNAHKADGDVHLSAADRAKFDGIEPGAEPNQNAFAQVNDVVAASETDALTIEGGTGITVSTNPTTRKVIVTATGDATPGAHGSSHNNDGADPIPDLVALRDEFDTLTPADIGAETPAGAQAKVDALAGTGNTKTVAEVADDVAGVTAQLADFVTLTRFGNSKNSDVIQAALDYAESVGGSTVYVPSGTYDITEILEIASNTKLIGLGEVVFKRMAEISAILVNKADGVTGGYEANKNIEIENITFDANNTAFTTNVTSLGFGHCKSVEVRNCRFKGLTTWHDIEFNAVKNGLVDNCEFEREGTGSEIVQFDFAGSPSQWPWFGPFDDTHCRDITIKECRFIDISTAGNLTAIGNHTFKSGVFTKNFRIKNNRFEYMAYCINHQDVDGLYVKDNIMINSHVGVLFEEKQNDSRVWRISDNFFDNQSVPIGDGRLVWGKSYPLSRIFEDIKINNNTIKKATLHGIGLTITRNMIISNNTIEYCGRNGIFVFGGSDVIISNNICSNNNRLSEGNRADIVVGGSPVFSTDVNVFGNTIETCISSGNVSKALYTNNIIKTSMTNNSGAEGIVKSNLIAGVWSP